MEKRAIIWPIALVICIFLVSGSSEIASPKLGLLMWDDKLKHLLVFGLMGTAIIRIQKIHRLGVIGALIAILLVSLYGATDEYHQSFTANRSVEFGDWLADTLGALLAVTLYCRCNWYRKLLEFRCHRHKKTATSPEGKTAV